MSKIKRINLVKYLVLMLIAVASLFIVGCESKSNKTENSHLISISLSSSSFLSSRGITNKTTYIRGQEFDFQNTYVDIKFYKEKDNIEYNWYCYDLAELGEVISLKYDIRGFDTSAVASNQKITIVITSDAYEGELTLTYDIQVVMESITSSVLVDFDGDVVEKFYKGQTISAVKIRNTYNNGVVKDEVIPSGVTFDTSTCSAGKKYVDVEYECGTARVYYYVYPSEDYYIFKDDISKLSFFAPKESLEYTYSKSGNTHKWTKSGSSIEIGTYSPITMTETNIKQMYNTSGSLINSNVVIDRFEQSSINGISCYECEFHYKNYTKKYKAYYINKRVTIGNVTQSATIEFIISGYSTSNEIFQNVIESLGY